MLFLHNRGTCNKKLNFSIKGYESLISKIYLQFQSKLTKFKLFKILSQHLEPRSKDGLSRTVNDSSRPGRSVRHTWYVVQRRSRIQRSHRRGQEMSGRDGVLSKRKSRGGRVTKESGLFTSVLNLTRETNGQRKVVSFHEICLVKHPSDLTKTGSI